MKYVFILKEFDNPRACETIYFVSQKEGTLMFQCIANSLHMAPIFDEVIRSVRVKKK